MDIIGGGPLKYALAVSGSREMEMVLSRLLGVKVELVSRKAVSPHMREGIDGEAVTIG